MKRTKIFCLLLILVAFVGRLSAQVDSTLARKKLIELYVHNHDKNAAYQFKAANYTKPQADSLYKAAVDWKKWAFDYPLIMNYLHLSDTTSPVAKRTLSDLEQNPQKRNDLLTKAIKYYQTVGFPGQPAPNPAGSTSKSSGAGTGIKNNDAQIKDSILKTWKF